MSLWVSLAATKSTIAKLIAGFWDVDGGDIKLGQSSLKKPSQKQISENIAYISQDNYLFNDTVLENIRMGKQNATDDEVIATAKAVDCDAFIQGLENGYQTRVGGSSSHLFGVQHQHGVLKCLTIQ